MFFTAPFLEDDSNAMILPNNDSTFIDFHTEIDRVVIFEQADDLPLPEGSTEYFPVFSAEEKITSTHFLDLLGMGVNVAFKVRLNTEIDPMIKGTLDVIQSYFDAAVVNGIDLKNPKTAEFLTAFVNFGIMTETQKTRVLNNILPT